MQGWQSVGNLFFNTRDVYDYPADLGRSEVVDSKAFLNPALCSIAVCPCGGPIASIEKHSSQRKSRIAIFTPSYRLIAESAIPVSAPIVGVWWSFSTTTSPFLVIVTSDWSIRTIQVRPQRLFSASLDDAEAVFPLSLPTGGGGNKNIGQLHGELIGVSVSPQADGAAIAFLAEDMSLFLLSGDITQKQRPCLQPLALLPKGTSVTCFSVLSPSSSVVCGTESGALVLATASSSTVIAEAVPASAMALSFSGHFLATYAVSGVVNTFSTSDLAAGIVKPIEQTRLDIGLSHPTHMAWVGDDCLCLAFESQQRHVLFIGGIGQHWSPYEHDSAVVVTSDLFCASVLTRRKFQIVHRVSLATQNAQTGSNEPEARLVLGYKKFLSKDVEAESVLRAIKPQLDRAVSGCVEAAAFETPFAGTRDCAKQLLEAAVFGKQFLSDSTASAALVNTAGLIRLCHAVNVPSVGIPISIPQLMHLGPAVVGARILVHLLSQRGEYVLANRVAEWTAAPSELPSLHSVVFDMWAVDLIHSSVHLPDRDLCSLIVERMPRQRHSLSRIAKYAFTNRPKLATALLEFEQDPAAQVSLLLSLDSDSAALLKALESKDPDLVHLCFDYMIANRKSITELITARAGAFAPADISLLLALVQSRYLSEGKAEDLCKLLQAIPGTELLLADSALELALGKVGRGKGDETAEWLQYAAERFSDCVLAPSVVSGLGCQSTANLLAESAALIRAQIVLERTAVTKGWSGGNHKFVGLSLYETLERLLRVNEVNEAEALRNKRRVSDGKWWELRVRALVANGKAEEAAEFANRQPPPTVDCRGYKVVVESLLAAKRTDLALGFVKKLKPKKQAQILTQLGMHEEARSVTSEVQRSGGFLGRLTGGFIGR